MNLFPITNRLSCKIYESRVPRGNWKQISLKQDASNFSKNVTANGDISIMNESVIHGWRNVVHGWRKP